MLLLAPHLVGDMACMPWSLLAVVAIGEMLGAAGMVGVDGGGWEGRIVGCLFIVDDNKSSVGVCRCSLWV